MNTFKPLSTQIKRIGFSQRWIFLALLLILFVTLSCNLPLGFLQSTTPEEALGEKLAAAGLLNVEEIYISENQVTVQYALLLEEDLEVMVSGWLTAINAAHEAAPDAGEIILLITNQGAPHLEVTALTADLIAFSENEISLDSFLEELQILDLRSLETRVMSLLLNQDLDVREVSLAGQALVVEYHPAPAEDQSVLMAEWVMIFGLIAEENPAVEIIQIRSVMLDTSVFVVEVDSQDLAAYTLGEITPFQLLASLMISEEPVVLDGE